MSAESDSSGSICGVTHSIGAIANTESEIFGSAKTGDVGRGAAKLLSLSEHVIDAELSALWETLKLCDSSTDSDDANKDS